MKQFKFIFIVLMLFAMSCSDSKENDPGSDSETTTNNVDAEKQIEEALTELSKDGDLSTFTEALKAVDAKTLEGKEFTLLAYKNKIEEDEKQAKTVRATSEDADVLRHMVSGSYTLEQLKKEKKLLALSKDTLYIESLNDEVTVNGVKLGKSMVVDNSIIFVVDSIIPVIEVPVVEEGEKEQYDFTVYNINSNWSPEQANMSEGTAGGVNVDIYEIKDTITFVKTVVADAKGKVNFTHDVDTDLYYSISKGDWHNTFNGYAVAGLFTSQEELDNPLHPLYKSIKMEVGGLIIVDVNGDGQITEDDKVQLAPLSNLTTEVYLVPESFKVNNGPADITLNDAYDAYYRAESTFYRIDNGYSTLAKRKTINASDSIITRYWDESYNAISLINAVLEKGTNKDALLDLKEKRADIYATLATFFGRVPLQLTYPLDPSMPQSSQKEAQDLVENDLNEVMVNVADTAKTEIYLKLALLYRQCITDDSNFNFIESYAKSLNFLKSAINNGTLSTNPSRTGRMIYLLASEMTIEASGGGNLAEAAAFVNILYNAQGKIPPLMNGATEREILEVVKRDLKALDRGMKFINAKNWEDMAEWGHYELLPIPLNALGAPGSQLTQNQGW